MRILDRQNAFERMAFRSGARRQSRSCRVHLRVALHEFLLPPFHRPTGCPHWHYVLNLGKRP